MSSEYTKWCAKPTADRTWTNGKAHFRKALRQADKINKLTAAEAGLGANAMEEKERQRNDARNEISEAMTVAFDNLAMAATAKAETIDNMAGTIEKLTATVAKLTKTNEELVAQIKRLKVGTGPSNTTNKRNTADLDKNGFKLNGYCWTCGYKVKKGHHSGNCRFKDNPGHCARATRKNPMGGSMLNAGFGNQPNGLERVDEQK